MNFILAFRIKNIWNFMMTSIWTSWIIRYNSFDCTNYTEEMWEIQKIMKIKNLVIWNTGKQSSQFLCHFKEEHGLFMRCDHLKSFDFNRFLKNWMNGEKEHLKSICCLLPKYIFHSLTEAEIFEGIQIDKLEDSVQKKFDYGPLIEKYDRFLPRCAFMNGTKIERKSDGKWATVFFTEPHFAFFYN
ncbi:hypothetical protein B9Z55_004481 [Caenorhabditis nigoni]|nr:hypothetical protein B9Z55_004481 [Caenorhabditis nigoni]